MDNTRTASAAPASAAASAAAGSASGPGTGSRSRSGARSRFVDALARVFPCVSAPERAPRAAGTARVLTRGTARGGAPREERGDHSVQTYVRCHPTISRITQAVSVPPNVRAAAMATAAAAAAASGASPAGGGGGGGPAQPSRAYKHPHAYGERSTWVPLSRLAEKFEGSAGVGRRQQRDTQVITATRSSDTLKPGFRPSGRSRQASGGSGSGGGSHGGNYGACSVTSHKTSADSWPLVSFAAVRDNPELQGVSDRPRVAVAQKGPTPRPARGPRANPRASLPDALDLLDSGDNSKGLRARRQVSDEDQERPSLKTKSK